MTNVGEHLSECYTAISFRTCMMNSMRPFSEGKYLTSGHMLCLLEVPHSSDISFHLKDFKAAAENVRKLEKTPPNDVFASLYSLYKQATVGDCDKGKLALIGLVRAVLGVSGPSWA